MHRVGRALRRHHGGGRDLVDLHDRGLLTGADCKQRHRHGLGVLAFVDRHDPVVFLLRIEGLGELLDHAAELVAHRVPPLDFGHGARRRRRAQHRGHCGYAYS
jgi:hypothetical protein